jgi:hypothetical protein
MADSDPKQAFRRYEVGAQDAGVLSPNLSATPSSAAEVMKKLDRNL